MLLLLHLIDHNVLEVAQPKTFTVINFLNCFICSKILIKTVDKVVGVVGKARGKCTIGVFVSADETGAGKSGVEKAAAT